MADSSKMNRVVLKIGSSTLTHKQGLINIRAMEQLVKVISDIKNSGKEIIIVSSGAVAVGIGKMGLLERPKDIPSKQAVAAVGQCELMYLYDKMFSVYHHTVAQILLTADINQNEELLCNVQNTFRRLLEMNVLPIVNENDSVCTEELAIGDNDNLSCHGGANGGCRYFGDSFRYRGALYGGSYLECKGTAYKRSGAHRRSNTCFGRRCVEQQGHGRYGDQNSGCAICART